jgi:heat shock protein HslJ
MIRMLLLIVPAALLAGCAMTPPPVADAGQSAYMAIGSEPFWSLEITPARLTFNEPGAAPLIIGNPGERREGESRTIVTRRISVRIVPGTCSDGMDDRHYSDSVAVRIGNGPRHLNGCGGAILPRATLEGSNWRIVAINDVPVAPTNAAAEGRVAELRFADGRMSGSAGCNRLSGSYSVADQRLTVGPVMATRMLCSEILMTREHAVIAILGAPLNVRYNARGRLVLTGPAGSLLLDQII